jgi:hypothetical protein
VPSNLTFCSKITPKFRLKTLPIRNLLFKRIKCLKLFTAPQTNISISAIKKETVVGRELALLSHLGSGEPDDCVGGVLLDTTQRPPRLS